MRARISKIVLGLILLCGIAVATPSVTIHADEAATPAASATPDGYGGTLVKTTLISDQPASAPGETLALTRFVIPAGSALPVHRHPGIQMATVESGTITYHVISNGVVLVTRADGTKEQAGPGSTVVLTTGDTWEEPEGMVHYAENLTDQPVVLLSTSLLATDQDATILVNATPGVATPDATPAP
ncbi:MAG TPA: cupin domain-containing protein [Thermomicrobiales bacterium]|nr:cupin domain-containing protein [Thermomicrobiales bacterium]